MIAAFIFFAHYIFTIIIFTKKWQDENLSGALLNIGLIGVLFAVGWTMTTMLAKIVMEPEGFGIYYDRDTFALTLLALAEYFFYRMYYKDAFIEAGTEKQ
ncbi:MAG: hypothetical protein COZ80_00430 [Ignavibacteria bacterium CG_4_8_14_3_um_filter_37_9]|nr:hypothetical protein [Ignavibacteria bacterium]OIO21509.1 MAG: hypothetical protein AUJ54_04750 [Ignavibacteria bacterium CG1_02_37_35]PIS45093.1 MAG: hypothetical protein COT22_07045 [Ignavibacteria bacterium CG08_land_8_20_14_0_20_37_9]PIX00389.1 MAG: hypothetical protein COZ80_00430 [Ignavibacteria bacterium CG_4_8_14_3_um_filter_37_9]PIX93190.1 MAG: hypothetical protein COZ25_11970 [Ignavibacteria bacterium CG_4_10_14_3_um_filter_37_18]PJC57887.1 MAG: hypothetical protein CO025_11020 [I